MTVHPAAFYGFIWLAAIAAFLAWYFQGKLVHANNAARVHKHNADSYAQDGAQLIAAILDRAQIKTLPALNATKWSAILDLYDDAAILPFEIPAQITTDHDDRPAVYWKVTNVNELDAYVIARLWLAGVL